MTTVVVISFFTARKFSFSYPSNYKSELYLIIKQKLYKTLDFKTTHYIAVTPSTALKGNTPP